MKTILVVSFTDASGYECFERTGTGTALFGPTLDLENFPTSGVKGRVLLEATHPVDHLTLESHKATIRTALLNR